MSHCVRFRMSPEVPLDEAEQSLHLAMFAVEGLVGRSRVRLDTEYQVDDRGRTIAVKAASHAGEMVQHVFAALLSREFGENTFQVERGMDRQAAHPSRLINEFN